jgi:site-specific recombinase XerD
MRLSTASIAAVMMRFVFNTERGGPVTRAWLLKMVRRTGELAKLPFPVHPHMLRHACGFKLANDGVDTRALQHFLGHRNIMHTVKYTELRADRFNHSLLGGLTPST